MKVTIAIPSNRGIIPATFQSVLDLIARGGYDFHLIVPEEGYTIAENRNYIVYQALNNKSDYLLMVDDDMTFPADMLDKLIKNDKDIVGVIHHPREGEPVVAMEEGKLVKEFPEELFECHAVGTGIILIKCNIFHKIPTPWFEFTYKDSGQCKQGEDWNFCEKAKRNNYKIYTDPTIKVGHWGEKIY